MTLIKFNNRSFSLIILGLILFFAVRLFIWIQFDFAALLGTGDDSYYIDVAQNIINQGEHVSAGHYSIRAPGYPFFLATLLNLNIEIKNSINIYLVQSVLLFITYLISFFIIKSSKPKAASLVFLLLCLSPFDAVYNGRVLSENLLTPLVLTSIVLLLFLHKNKFFGYILPGILLGLLALVKDIFLLLPLFIALFMFFNKTNVKYVAIFLIAYSCTVSPWILRNATLPSDGFIGVSKGIFWTNLWAGTWLRDDLSYSSAAKTGFIEKNQVELFNTKRKNMTIEQDFFREAALNNFIHKPFQVLGNWVYRVPKMWIGTRTDLFKMRFETGSSYWYISKLFFFGVNLVIMLIFLALVAVGIAKKDRAAYLSLVFILYSLFIYMPFYNIETRYSQPVFSVMLLYIALSGVIIKDIVKNTKNLFNIKKQSLNQK